MRDKETAASWLVKQGPDSELARRLAASCDTPDIDLSWVFPIIARSLIAQGIVSDFSTRDMALAKSTAPPIKSWEDAPLRVKTAFMDALLNAVPHDTIERKFNAICEALKEYTP